MLEGLDLDRVGRWLEANVADVEFSDGKYRVVGTDREKAFGEVAFAAYVQHNYPIDTVEPGMEDSAFYDPKNFTFPGGCHTVVNGFDPLGRDDGVTAIGHGRTRHDTDRFATTHAPAERRPRQRVANHLQWDPVICRGALGAIRNDGVAVHRGAVESWDVQVADDCGSEHAACGIAEVHVFGSELMELCVQPLERRRHSVASREALHADVVWDGFAFLH